MPEPYDSLEGVGGIAAATICFPRLLSVRMSRRGGGALFCTNRGAERGATGGPHYLHAIRERLGDGRAGTPSALFGIRG
ncbi:hypothetical protein EYF80_059384 [Liparis tanakae]|uniref:Uncharacterized protein n=1 Tax=Liparis tanakae TaxID=230148 RepID=A0A4Z2EPY7_9TELE|nr:hypothetical protein EYF80_059384 [Liparis tanakae]